MTEFDETLSRLFAETRQAPPPDDFLEGVTRRLRGENRRRAFRRAVVIAPAVGLALVSTPYIVAGSLAVAGRLGGWLPAIGNALTSPVAWLGALAVAWGVRRMRHG